VTKGIKLINSHRRRAYFQYLLINVSEMRKFTVLFFVSMFLLVSGLSAQVINIEKQRKDKSKSFYGNVKASLQYQESNSSLWRTSLNGDVYLRLKNHLFMSFTNWDYFRSGKDQLQDYGYEHLRYNWMIDSIFTFEIFGQYQFNDFRKVEYRALGGAGIRINIIAGDSLRWFTGVSGMYEDRFFTYEGTGQHHWRINLYTNIDWDINKHINLSGIAYYQPALDDFSNQNLSGEARLKFDLVKKFKFYISSTLTYESDPPEGTSNLYTVIKNGISWEF